MNNEYLTSPRIEPNTLLRVERTGRENPHMAVVGMRYVIQRQEGSIAQTDGRRFADRPEFVANRIARLSGGVGT